MTDADGPHSPPGVAPRGGSKHPGRLKRSTVLRALSTQGLFTRKHPRVIDRGRALVANLSLGELILGFVLAVVALALAFGALLSATENSSGLSYFDWSKEAFMGLVGSGSERLQAEPGDTARQVVEMAIGIAAIVLPGVILGAIVFRIFVRERLLVFRKAPSLIKRNRKNEERWFVAVRLYSGSYLLALDLHFSIFLQRAISERDGGLVLENCELQIENPRWPVGSTHTPYTLLIPLTTGDVRTDEEGKDYAIGIQGHLLDPDCALIIHSVGHLPELGSEFSEHQRVEIELPLLAGGFHGVAVQYDGKGPTWEGWDRFDEEQIE